MTSNERVLQYLTAREGRWCCGLDLADPYVGGLRAAARIHDLRGQDVPIESRPCVCWGCRDRKKLAQQDGRRFHHVSAYRLVRQQEAA